MRHERLKRRDIASQTGRLAIVTGAKGRLEYETALALAGAGGEVILGARNEAKGRAAVASILARHPAAAVCFEYLDLASLASVAAFAARLRLKACRQTAREQR